MWAGGKATCSYDDGDSAPGSGSAPGNRDRDSTVRVPHTGHQRGGAMSQRTERVADVPREQLPTAESSLLLARSHGGVERSTCIDLLSQHPFDVTKLVHVCYRESPTDRYEFVDRHCHEHPNESAVVTVSDSGESHSTPQDYYVESVADPADLTGVGIALNKCLTQWDQPSVRLGLCFDSLSVLLQYAEFERVFKFLHTLTNKLAAVDATAHFHLDPSAHDEREVAQLRQVFDSVVRVEQSGDWAVER